MNPSSLTSWQPLSTAALLPPPAAVLARPGPLAPPEPVGPPAPGQARGGAPFLASFAGYADFSPSRVAALDLFSSYLHLAEDDVAGVADWHRAFLKLDKADRVAQLHHLEWPLVCWFQSVREQPTVQLRGAIALTLIVDGGLYQDFCVRHRLPIYTTAGAFLRGVLNLWGVGASKSRVCHMQRSARFWLQLQADGLPLPPCLPRIEELALLPDALAVYRELCLAAPDQAPTDGAIQAKLAELKGRPPKSKLPATPLRFVVTEQAEKGQKLLDLENVDRPALRAIFLELLAAARPKPKKRPPVPRPPRPAPYAKDLGCPFTLTATGRPGEILVTVSADLGPPWAGLVWVRANERSWLIQEAKEGMAWLVRIDPNDPDRQRADRAMLQSDLAKLCDRIGAPAPALPDLIACVA